MAPPAAPTRSPPWRNNYKFSNCILIFLAASVTLFNVPRLQVATAFDYKDALHKSILFYEAQRSGKLPSNQGVTWRGDSALHDGSLANVDLAGGYYDAGDNVKFGFPMAFTVTMLSWGVLQYGTQLSKAGELQNVQAAIKWGTDYLLKAHTGPTELYVQVGDPNTDHQCWQRPEDMDTARTVLKVTASSPGSEVVAETAAALAAASMIFKNSNSGYATKLQNAAIELFNFADGHRGTFTGACPYYCSSSGYWDELLWASAWLYKATLNSKHIDYVLTNQYKVSTSVEFSWENKVAGVHILLSKLYLSGQGSLSREKTLADSFICSNLPGSPTKSVKSTPGGLIWVRSGSNTQYGLNAAFLASVYVDYLASANINQIVCGGKSFSRSSILSFANSQVNYVLGNNPKGISYMVGFSGYYPKQAHHRGSSIDSIHVHPAKISCGDGFNNWYPKSSANPNLLTGAIVGGPDLQDGFQDSRTQSAFTEPTTYGNAPMVFLLARMLYG
ncbi:unnamed protein product [Calypogeia fissa]